MTRKYKIMAGILVLLLTFLIVAEATKKDPINWFASFGQDDKIPFGSYVLYNELRKAIPEDRLKQVNQPPFGFLEDSTNSGTYFFLNNSVGFDEAETDKLLDWVARGNTLYIAARYQSQSLMDTLKLRTQYFFLKSDLKKLPLLNLSNPDLKAPRPYSMDRDEGLTYFDEIDTTTTVVLGVVDQMRDNDSTKIEEPKINFISTPFENGKIIMHTFPIAFTNYFMLHRDNLDYTAAALGYLPEDGLVYLDMHYKDGKAFNTSFLHILFSNRYLRWAYYMLVLMALLWVYFNGKRKQRSIPIVKPLPNQTVDYSRTIAGMYLDKKANREIAMHQINHLMEYIRSHYLISTADRGEEFITKVAAKSGHTFAEVRDLIDYTINIRQKATVTEQELIKLNTLIENFKTPS
ncbi:MAG: DUF4350 domain-containing protein [Leeuwenhoekiella sp.]